MTIKTPVYMDYHATTPMDPRVLEAMVPYFLEKFGNAASRTHRFGWEAEAAVEDARDTIASLIGANSGKEIVFTSGATESNNLAIKGVAEYYKSRGNHIITSTIEHKAVLDSCKRLRRKASTSPTVKAEPNGIINPDAIRAAMTDRTILGSVMLANNEVGTVQPITEIGQMTRERGILPHTDAVQGVGKTPFHVEAMNVDLASLTAHKMYGPQGRRSSLRASSEAARTDHVANGWRRSRARQPVWYIECSRHRWFRQGGRLDDQRRCARQRPNRCFARSAACQADQRARSSDSERRSR